MSLIFVNKIPENRMTDIISLNDTIYVSCLLPCFPAYSCEECMARLPNEPHPALVLEQPGRSLQTRWSLQAGEYLFDYVDAVINHSFVPNCKVYVEPITQRVIVFAF